MELGPIGASEPLLAVTGVVIGVDALRARRFRRALEDPVLFFAATWVGVAITSAIVNGTPPHVVALGIVMTVDALAIYFVWRMLPHEQSHAVLSVAAVILLVCLASLVGIAQFVLDPDLRGFRRVGSFLGNPNMLGLVIALSLPFPLFAAAHLARRWMRIAAAAVTVVLMIGLVLTYSRGAWLAAAIGIFAGAILLDRRTFLLLVLAAAVAFVGASAIRGGDSDSGPGGGPPLSVAETVIARFTQFSQGDDVRLRWLADGIRVIGDHPWLGTGPGRYGGAAATIIPSPVYDEYDIELGTHRTVHNFWLHLTGEVGVVGLVVFLTMVGSVALRCVRAARRTTGARFVLLAGAATMVLVVALNDLTEMAFEGNVPGLLIWLILGIASMVAETSELTPSPVERTVA
ncbi:MAG: O-antigen ligase family protein [Chloroflexi bacterium]|nr:O-antigen ligase family protein [Chloroflexota bacterium]